MSSIRSSIAPLAKETLLRVGGYAAVRRVLPSRQLAILRYHAICGPEGYSYADPQICITPDNFEQHVAYLAKAYSVLRLEDAVQALADGAPLPANALVITFDDGYADNLAAARTLAKYGATATFYITAGCMDGGLPFWPAELRHLIAAMPSGRRTITAGPASVELDLSTAEGRVAAVNRLTKTFKAHPIPVREALREELRRLANAGPMPRVMLTWDEVREMHRLGMTIGSHTMTHPNLPNAGVTAARTELVGARQRLEAEIDAPVTMFSYPNGGAERYMTPEVREIVREVGYAGASTSRNAFAGRHSDVFALERIEVEESLSHLVFALEIERFAFKPQPRPGERR